MNKSNWDDIRFVLAVAETGSLNAAATRLGVTHATVLRRVGMFEHRHGQTVFQRLATGYRVLPDAEPVLTAARNVQDAVLAVDRAFVGADQALSGTVRVTSTDSLCKCILPEILSNISANYPDLTLTVLSANTRHDFLRLSADIAVRPALSLEDGMTGDRAGQCAFGLYAAPVSTGVAAGVSTGLWLGLDGALQGSRPALWMQEAVPADRIVHRADSFLVLQELAAAGLGKAILPRFVGDADARLTRLRGEMPAIAVPVWVATLDQLAGNARFRAVRDILVTELDRALAPFSGPETEG